MRITNVLLKESHRWRFKTLWQQKGAFLPPKLQMPLFVRDGLGDGTIKVQTAAEMMNSGLKFPMWEPPVKDDPQSMPIKTFKDDLNYHDEAVYEYMARVRLMEGEKQALILTKTQPFYELPEGVKRLVGSLTLADQDLLMQRIIMQSNVWDPSKDKLPRRYNTQLPGWKFKAEHGIKNGRIASTMIRNIVQLCEMAYPLALEDRRTIFDPSLSTFYFFDGKHIAINAENDLLVCSRRALPAFAEEATVDASTNFQLPYLFPLAPTIDLRKTHVWKTENQPGWRDGFTHPHAHTMFVKYDDRWTTTQRNAKALMYCFGQTAAQARRQHGMDVKTLPKPIAMQCVLTNGFDYSLVCFQLNTLDVSGSEGGRGVKNLVWFDADNAMYNKIVPRRSMLRNTKYEDYDPTVLTKLFALYAYGKA